MSWRPPFASVLPSPRPSPISHFLFPAAFLSTSFFTPTTVTQEHTETFFWYSNILLAISFCFCFDCHFTCCDGCCWSSCLELSCPADSSMHAMGRSISGRLPLSWECSPFKLWCNKWKLFYVSHSFQDGFLGFYTVSKSRDIYQLTPVALYYFIASSICARSLSL